MKDWRADQLPVWRELAHSAEAMKHSFRLTEAFAEDPLRQEKLSIWAPEIFADFSKSLVDMPAMGLLQQLAREAQIESRRDEVLSGGLANLSEGRAALHTALRAPRGQAPHSKVVHDTLDEMLAFADEVRDTRMSGIRHIVNIGIGGSDLGPQMAVAALDPYEGWDLSFDFVSNVDGQDIARILRDKMPEHTLFVIASKTFTTQETMSNAMAAKTWFLDRGGRDLARHFVATTSNVKAAREFGIDRTFSLWDWVGGRYSIWSSIGLPIALAIGSKHFRDFLSGAHAMDVHFAKAPLAQNLPIQLALLDVWYRNFMGFTSRSIAPYHHGLRRLPAYLQQLEMESNGKGVSAAGLPLNYATSPVVWGEPGTDGQHAYFQMLHQGPDVIPLELILVREPTLPESGISPEMRSQLLQQHRKLVANGISQAQALMLGKSYEQALAEPVQSANPAWSPEQVARQRSFPGNRPSLVLAFERMCPRALGALIALYEHRVTSSGLLWGINSFDQWGVELGKTLSNAILPRLKDRVQDGLDPSTADLVRRLGGPLPGDLEH